MNRPSPSLPTPPGAPQDALSRVRIVLSNPSHPGNVGAAARAMKTMGLSRLYLVNPKRFPDPEAVARAAGADDVLADAVVCATLDEALAGTVFAAALSARHRNLGPERLQAREAAPLILAKAEAGAGDAALVFGNETAGLSNDDVLRCQRTVFIPANPEYASLNLGAAVQVLSYELRMAALGEAAAAPADVQAEPATHADFEGFMGHLERVVTASGFHDPANPKRLLPRMRRLFNRVRLEKEEVAILRGMLTTFETPKRRG